jgi:hypothetical protein
LPKWIDLDRIRTSVYDHYRRLQVGQRLAARVFQEELDTLACIERVVLQIPGSQDERAPYLSYIIATKTLLHYFLQAHVSDESGQ